MSKVKSTERLQSELTTAVKMVNSLQKKVKVQSGQIATLTKRCDDNERMLQKDIQTLLSDVSELQKLFKEYAQLEKKEKEEEEPVIADNIGDD